MPPKEAKPPTLTQVMDAITALSKQMEELYITFEAHASGRLAPAHDFSSAKVFFDPKAWHGESCRGKDFTTCPPDFLEIYAEALQQIGEGEQEDRKLFNDKPSWVRTFRTASRARRWALRKRLGWKPPQVHREPVGWEGQGFEADGPKKPPPPRAWSAEPEETSPEDEEIPF